MNFYEKYLEPVIEEFTTGDYFKEVFAAKQEFFDKSGVVYEDDVEFESRMSIFMDWYLFDRDLPGVDLPPMRYYFRKYKDKLSSEDLAVYKDLCATTHSIFRLTRFALFKKALYVEDLFSKKKYRVGDPMIARGFNRGDIFEARIVLFKGGYEFSRGFCFHPVEMQDFILQEIKKVRFQDHFRQTKLIMQLSSMKLKHSRFQHIDVRHIYNFASKF